MRNLKLDSIGSPLSEKDIASFEAVNEIRLPSDYRKFLLSFNGGTPNIAFFDVPGDDAMSGLVLSSLFRIDKKKLRPDERADSNSISWAWKIFRLCLPAKQIPIGMVGNYDLISLDMSEGHGLVYLVLTYEFGAKPISEGPPFERFFLASSFSQFIDMLYGSIDPRNQ